MSKRGNAEWQIYRTLESIIPLIKDTIKNTERVGEWDYLLPMRCEALARYLRTAANELEEYADKFK